MTQTHDTGVMADVPPHDREDKDWPEIDMKGVEDDGVEEMLQAMMKDAGEVVLEVDLT